MQQSKRKLSARDTLVVPAGQRDRGSSLIEILVSMVILSTGIIAVLVALGTTIHASAVDKNVATAYEYVQDISDQIYEANRVPCYQGLAAVQAAYDAAAKLAPVPPGWTKTATVTNVEFLGKAAVNDPFSWGAFCFESSDPLNQYYTSPLYTQKITFTVKDPKGLLRTMQVVKSAK
jgi:type II secretory pathway pseudopilin PulG